MKKNEPIYELELECGHKTDIHFQNDMDEEAKDTFMKKLNNNSYVINDVTCPTCKTVEIPVCVRKITSDLKIRERVTKQLKKNISKLKKIVDE